MPEKIETLLLDLDGTLLSVDMRIFVPAYIELLAPRLAHLIPPSKFKYYLLNATQVMVNNLDPSLSNEEVFYRAFCDLTGCSRQEITPILEDFYENDFGSLDYLTEALPTARLLLESACQKGLEIIIATNPVFPKRAVEHRLRWAKIDDLPFRLITTLENMHFCKPHPQYYAEILEKIDQKAELCLMAGNDAGEDLTAGALNIKTFLVEDYLIPSAKALPYTYKGSLYDLYLFIKYTL